jgi:hypothetical protein
MLGVFLMFYNPKLFKIKSKSIPAFFGMGVISFSLFNICYFKSMQFNSIGTACILLYTAPIFVMLLSALLLFYLVTSDSFGAPILAPFSPLNKRDLRDSIVKYNMQSLNTRPKLLNSPNKTRLRVKNSMVKGEDNASQNQNDA